MSKSGQVVYTPKLIAINYIKGWFLLDLLAAIPFDLLYAFQVPTVSTHSNKFYAAGTMYGLGTLYGTFKNPIMIIYQCLND